MLGQYDAPVYAGMQGDREIVTLTTLFLASRTSRFAAIHSHSQERRINRATRHGAWRSLPGFTALNSPLICIATECQDLKRKGTPIVTKAAWPPR
jgi:hypothetical protein